ncbi:Uncharacterised protein [Chryseobacterium taklimakanense]|uniref:Uncharacterized protein n=1 Tax=Chryseobacterium taklimakanense TaxID=536441 RepID=A0A239XUV4_9FLAO|nr:Uncharacterised protein [Chryseobacterium taklimakanense]
MGKATGGLVQQLSSCCVRITNSDTLFNGSFGSFFSALWVYRRRILEIYRGFLKESLFWAVYPFLVNFTKLQI